ncbi:glycoside hydrolase family 18 protein [Tunturibacter empetritectus]|uniref:glycoside hydrolase family 18 protein n=2 Tax=Tunturiibacter empetritectus TaxID=3069691 RepID=UPI00288C5A4A|nr:glycoside hydrolase family 18 protein [Edaphobacter lichenicola]
MKVRNSFSKLRVCHSLSQGLIILTLSMCAPVPSHAAASPAPKQEIIAYIFPKDRIIAPGEVSAEKLTRINYAFADLQNGKIVEGFAHDAENFAALNALKHANPSLTVLVSIGGWAWSGNFSDMALTKQRRKIFIESTVQFIEKYDLDGLDIDWEYPGMSGDNHRFRPEDKQNYTLLLKELRARFNHEEKKLHRHLVTSIATGASTEFLEHTEMAKVQKYVDTVNLMSYDYYVPSWDKTTGHHAPLFTNPADPKKISADRTIHEYESAGVPAKKLVLGVPFYGKSWTQVPNQNHGLFQPGKEAPNTYLPYSSLISLQSSGYIRYWDAQASAPYLYNPDTQTFISYEDPESLKKKCEYGLDHKLAGVMFWEYSGDSANALLDSIDTGLQYHPATATESK